MQADIRPPASGPRAYRGGAFKTVTKVNQEKTAQRIALANSKKYGVENRFYPGVVTKQVVYDEYYVPVPTYVAVTYSITLRAEYQQQMNQMILPFIAKTGQVNHFVIKKDNHRFESFIQQDYSQSNNLNNLSQEERKFETKVDIKVLGYIIGEDQNEERPKITKRETVVTVYAPIETITAEIGNTCREAVSRIATLYEEDKTVHAIKELISTDDAASGSPETQFRKVTPDNYVPGQGTIKLSTAIDEELAEVDCDDE